MSHFDLAILGAGAAGLIAAATAAEETLDSSTGKSRLRIALFEKNPQPGIKVLVCGGGRCNFTNAGSIDFLISQFGRNGRFLTPALRHLDNTALRDWFAARGVPSHEEHDGKIYPDSNQARSVVNALVKQARNLGVEILTARTGTITSVERVTELTTEDTESTENENNPSVSVRSVSSVVNFKLTASNGDTHTAHTLLATLGGMSYQRMGTTGDGYTFAQSLGHSIVTPRPAIVGLLATEDWIKDLQGLAVENVEVRIAISGNLPKLTTGKPTPSVNDMLFTHFGLSGPAILNLSEIVAELLEKFETIPLMVDFAYRATHEELHTLMRSWQQREGKKLLRKLLSANAREVMIQSTSPDQTAISDRRHDAAFSLPARLAEKFLQLEDIPRDQPCATLTSAQIHRLVERIKHSRFTITATRGFKEAMVTAGGIKLAEVDPNTLESKLCQNLFLAGEVLDLTGPSGGYNLQLAFSTGHLAATTIAHRFNG